MANVGHTVSTQLFAPTAYLPSALRYVVYLSTRLRPTFHGGKISSLMFPISVVNAVTISTTSIPAMTYRDDHKNEYLPLKKPKYSFYYSKILRTTTAKNFYFLVLYISFFSISVHKITSAGVLSPS